MDFLANIPTFGWIVVLITVFLIFGLGVLIIRWLSSRVLSFKKGDAEMSIVEKVDTEIKKLKSEIAEKDKYKMHDEELRKALYRKSGTIDEKLKADARRILRQLKNEVQNIFSNYMKCEMLSSEAIHTILDVLDEKTDYNNLKEKLAICDKAKYLQDIIFEIEKNYKTFLNKVPTLPCTPASYPKWEQIEAEVKKVVEVWAEENITEIIFRLKEKIKMYKDESEVFKLEEFKEASIDYPIAKNKKYIINLKREKALEGII